MKRENVTKPSEKNKQKRAKQKSQKTQKNSKKVPWHHGPLEIIPALSPKNSSGCVGEGTLFRSSTRVAIHVILH